MKIKHTGREVELGKRVNLPVVISDTCGECGTKCSRDYKVNYLDYPIVNAETIVYFYCDECDHDWTKKVKIEIRCDYV